MMEKTIIATRPVEAIVKDCLERISHVKFQELEAADLVRDRDNATSKESKEAIQKQIDAVQIGPEAEAVIVAEIIRERLQDIDSGIFFDESGSCYIYNGKCYELLRVADAKHFFTDAYSRMGVPKNQAGTVSTAKRLIEQAAYTLYKPIPKPEKGVSKINTLNYTLEIRDGKVTPQGHKPEDFFFHVLPYGYDPAADCPLFKNFLNEVLPGDIQLPLQEFIGCCLDPGVKLEKALVCVGTGMNGKSVFFNVVSYVLGTENVTNFNINSLCEDKSSTRILIANKLLNYSSDFNGKIWSNGIFKQMVSGEPLEAKRLYQDPEIIRRYARLAFNTNQMPDSSDTSAGFRRRLLPVEFAVKISKDREDPHLSEKLIQEASGILNWAIEGLKRYIANGYKLSYSAMLDEKEREYQEETESVCMFITAFGYQKSDKQTTKLSDLVVEYRQYCDTHSLKAETKSEVKSRLRDLGFEVIQEGNKAIEIGISKIGYLPFPR